MKMDCDLGKCPVFTIFLASGAIVIMAINHRAGTAGLVSEPAVITLYCVVYLCGVMKSRGLSPIVEGSVGGLETAHCAVSLTPPPVFYPQATLWLFRLNFLCSCLQPHCLQRGLSPCPRALGGGAFRNCCFL